MSKLILAEDEEAFVLENAWDTAIPISFTYTPAEGTVLTAFPQVETVARAFLDTYGDDPTAEEALTFLYAQLAPYREKWGYHDDRFRDRWGYILRTAPGFVPGAHKGGPVRLEAADETRNETSYDLAATCEAGCLGYGVAEGGKIVSLAVTHEAPDAPLVEVGVETIPAARGRGYATACLQALAADLCGQGIAVEYRCQRYNAASYRVARAAGLVEVGKYYYYVWRKN